MKYIDVFFTAMFETMGVCAGLATVCYGTYKILTGKTETK